MNDDRLRRQIEFLVEIDKLKSVYRQTMLIDGSRNEDDAEHSWHVAMMAILLAEHAAEKDVDVFTVVKMLLIHDLVEIDAGDTFAYDAAGHDDKAQREQAAADRIFNLLPADQAREMRALWDEFEARQSPEAKYAAALDRVQPMLSNYHTDGHAWKNHGISRSQVIARNAHADHGCPPLWAYARELIDQAVEKGYLREE
jgi:putative hydrolase of HD superfamily